MHTTKDIRNSEELIEVTKSSPCPHCGKEDWCYSIGNLTVCKRDAEPATGWERTKKQDTEGSYFYAPSAPPKASREPGKKEHPYTDNQGEPTIKVTVVRPGSDGRDKDVYQQYWGGKVLGWQSARKVNKEEKQTFRSRTTWYRYSELKNAIANGAKKLFIAEREGVADLLWDSGLTATTTIGGAGKYRKYGVGYKEDLEALGDIEIILCPDRDKPGLTHMEEINKDFPNAKWCYAPPEDFYWKNLPKSQGLDVKDWILEGATVEEILAAVEDRRELVEKLNSAVSAPDAEHTGAATCKLAQKYNLIAAAWGYRLRWNSMKKRVEMDGSPLPLDRIKLRVAKELDIELSKEDTLEIVLDLSQDNEYSPFKEYLEALPNGNPEFLNSLASRFLGTHDPLHQVLLKRTLIAAVARTFQPGCKHDTVCILQGKQGALKSTFWSVLAGEDNFTDDLSGTDKDEILKLSQYTMIEFAEFETAYRKKEVSALKAFLSRKSDSIRVPYGRDIQDIPRPSIFVGTTNKPEFLHDPTGERRYWAVPVECDRINIPQLKIDRDAIWAAAKAAYLAGEQWWLTSQEDEMLNTSNSDFASTDVWEEVIGDYVSLQSETSAREILSECLKIDVSMQDRAFQMRVTDILTRLGWRKGKKKKINGKVVQAWDKPTPKCNIKVATEVATQVATQVATTSNVDIASASVNEVATVATFSTNFKNEKTEITSCNLHLPLNSQESFEEGGSNQGGEISESTIEQEKSEVATSGLLPQLKMAILTNDYQRVKDITDPLPEPTKQELRVQLTAEEMGRCKELRREYELKLTTPNSQFPTPNSQALRQGTIVYPTCRQLKNKKCVLGTIDGSNYWVRLNNNSKGNGAVLYQADELSLQPPSSDTEPTNPNEEQLDLFNYEASEECEYLESIDD